MGLPVLLVVSKKNSKKAAQSYKFAFILSWIANVLVILGEIDGFCDNTSLISYFGLGRAAIDFSKRT